jgi:hypothetical protein
MGAIRRAARQVEDTASLGEQILAKVATSGIRVKLSGLSPLWAKILGPDASVLITVEEPSEEQDNNPNNEASQ